MLLLQTSFYAQQKELLLFSTDSIENDYLKKLTYNKTSDNIDNELKKVSNLLQKEGFFFNTLDSLVEKENHKAYYSLYKRYNKIIIKNNYSSISKTDSINLKNLDNYLLLKTNEFKKKGKLFSEVSLKNISSEKEFLFATLHFKKSRTRTIDRLIIKGYNKLSSSYLHHILNLKTNKILNDDKLKNINESLNSLSFISQIKKPEALFTKDSTLLYLFLKQKNNNNFEGLLNFSPNENNEGLLFTGFLNLELNNTLHKGEQVSINWKANGNESQNFTLSTKLPFLFKTPINTEANLNIYKKDSSFLNSKFTGNILYYFNSKLETGISYESESSQNTLVDNYNSINSFNTNFYGLFFRFKSTRQNIFNEYKFHITFNPSLGKRKSENKVENQTKLKINSSYIFNLNDKNSILIKSDIGLLQSNSFLDNELFRIGGNQNLRGVEQESIFTNKYITINSEYRLTSSESSFLYTIADIAQINTPSNSLGNLYTLGLGYRFKIKSSVFDINYSINNNINQSLSFSNSSFNFSLISFF